MSKLSITGWRTFKIFNQDYLPKIGAGWKIFAAIEWPKNVEIWYGTNTRFKISKRKWSGIEPHVEEIDRNTKEPIIREE